MFDVLLCEYELFLLHGDESKNFLVYEKIKKKKTEIKQKKHLDGKRLYYDEHEYDDDFLYGKIEIV
jgi:hypothetical protein